MTGLATAPAVGNNPAVGSLENLERRVAAVESELAVVRAEVAAARALAAGANRDAADDLAELRGQTRILAALRETQLEHVAAQKADMAACKTEMAACKAGMAEIKADIARIVRMLTDLGGRG